MSDDPGATRLQLADLDAIERAAKGDIPCCAGCIGFWQDPDATVRGWGWCRRSPPQQGNVEMQDGLPTVGYNWYCMGHRAGVHPAVRQARAEKREELHRRLKK